MPTKITKRTVDAAEPGERDYVLWDADLKGFGLKVTPKGGKIYIVQTRLGGRGSPTRRFTIGRHGSPWTPDKARTEAEGILRQTGVGTDPAKLKREAQEAERQALIQDERRQERAFSTFAQRYIERRLEGKDSAKLKESIIRRRFMARWQDRDIAVIGREDVAAVLDAIVDEGYPQAANNALRTIRPLFAYAVERGLIANNPASGLRTDVAEVSRDRVLTDDELREIWEVAGELAYPFGAMVKLLMLTGQRRNEVAGMRWAELDLEAGLWTIPSARTKNEKAHIVHLSPMAVDLLRNLPGLSKEYVFSMNGETPVSGFSKAKERLDGELLKARRKAALEAGEDPDAVKAMPGWNLHDLRRTMSTGMAQLGIAPHVAEKCINHVPKALSGVAAVYNRFEYMPERKAAFLAWGERIAEIVGAVAIDRREAEVVEFRRTANG